MAKQRIASIFLTIFVVKCTCIAQVLPTERPHASVVPFENLKTAIQGDFTKSVYYADLLHQAATKDNILSVSFTISGVWAKREVFLCAEALQMPSNIKINTALYATDSLYGMLNEWRITALLKKDSLNVIELIFPKSVNSMYALYVYATPKLQFRDFTVKSEYNPSSSTGNLAIFGEVRNLDKRDYYKYSVEFALYDAKGKLIFNEKSPLFSFAKTKTKTKGINYSRTVANTQKWSVLTPYEYTLVVTMWDGVDNSEIEIVSSKVAFKKIEPSYRSVFINEQLFPAYGLKMNDVYFSNPINWDEFIVQMKKHHIHMFTFQSYMPLHLQNKCVSKGILFWADSIHAFSKNFTPYSDTLSWKNIKFENPPLHIVWKDSAYSALRIKPLLTNLHEWALMYHYKLTTKGEKVKSGRMNIVYSQNGEAEWELPKIKEDFDTITITVIISVDFDWIKKGEEWHTFTLLK